MAKITRYNGNLPAFAQAAVGLERTIFGDTAQADDLTSQFSADFLRGWGIVADTQNPSREDFNAVSYTLSLICAYLHQMGVAEWNASQEYFLGSAVTYNGALYISRTINTNAIPASSTTNWHRIVDAGNYQALFDTAFNAKTTTFTRGLLASLTSAQAMAALGGLQAGNGGGQIRDNSQLDARYLIAGTAGAQIRNNSQLDARYLQSVPTNYQAIGSYIMATYRPTIGLPSPGGTTAGANLYPANTRNDPADDYGSLSGTWRLMGAIQFGTGVRDSRTSLWVRIS